MAGMIEVFEPREQIERVRYNDVMGDGEVMERSNAWVEVLRGGRVTVSGRDDVESDSWARVDVHIVNASTKKAKKNSGGRGGFRYGRLGRGLRPSELLKRMVMSYSCVSFSCFWSGNVDV